MPGEEWISVAEARTMKGVTHQAVYRAIADHRLRHKMVGKITLVNRADVEKWVPRPKPKRRP